MTGRSDMTENIESNFVLGWPSLWYALLYVLSSFAIILTRKRELAALLLLYFGCIVTVYVL